MKKILFSLFLIIFISAFSYARDVYCTIEKHNDNCYVIVPNYDYLNENYWNAITKDKQGKIKKFVYLQDAINQLSRFGWNVVKGQNSNDITTIMSHKVESIYELKNSREDIFNLENY